MKHYDGFLIDLDGTMYRGTEKIEEAVQFVKKLKEKNINYLFVTNNSTRTKEVVAESLQQFGVPATPDDVLTTSMATAQYIKDENPNASVYFIGEAGLKQALEEVGLNYEEENPDYVVMGMDREITYEKLTKACLAVRKGAKFVSTNPDIALPTERGFLPGNGSLTSVVSVSTMVDPIFIGKPEPIIVEQALKKIGTAAERTIMVGDNYHTDILAGLRAGIDTLLVHTGVTTKEMLLAIEEKPTYALSSLEEWTF
ncbi:TIGR01457 family HAD-type hydrolase [Terrilactibacillus sp. BCM23-1]|uniref:TIGR01457 family HAD-type hydrolase n=1 Tax=Terrilactibacillus tamarindi TaxID=2599694 RepID=A0A6N8CRR0_9BACI|nr:TIGR01457 family HAD-type hydrolase [Terrilactibacillus tamarindi]MTT30666.1 TIGR01457 family HAD-type hydrolase [Terrilactibacillus tamarindi]